MPRRDPETGKFVSGTPWSEIDVVTGSVASTIPAADLAGGTSYANASGEEVIAIDFTPVLDRGEVFEVEQLSTVATLSCPTTATAEGSAEIEWAVRSDIGEDETGVGKSFYTGFVDRSDGIIDISQHQTDEADDLLVTGRLSASPSHSDTVNGLAAGAENGFDRSNVSFGGGGPRFDENDALSVPHTFSFDNISDHAVTASVDVVLWGAVDG